MPCSAELLGTESTLQPKTPPTKDTYVSAYYIYTHIYIYVIYTCTSIYMWPRLLRPIQLIVHIIQYEPKVESYLKIYVPMLSFVLQRSRTPVGAIKLFVICNNNKLLPEGRWQTRINIYNVSFSLISLNLMPHYMIQY